MTHRTLPSIVLLMFASALAGCDRRASPLAPSSPPREQLYTLTPGASAVLPGAELSVSWTAARARMKDWIGLFNVGAPACDHGWSAHTDGATSGTFTLTAPTRAGRYEFRYHPDDSCDEVARSSVVTVAP
jgi:hypothetical protein